MARTRRKELMDSLLGTAADAHAVRDLRQPQRLSDQATLAASATTG